MNLYMKFLLVLAKQEGKYLHFCRPKIHQGSIMGSQHSTDKPHSKKHHWISSMLEVLHLG